MFFLGDSFTFGLDTPKKCKWVELLETKYSVDCVNKGIPGDTTSGMLSRFYRDVVMEKADVVFVTGGINDFRVGTDCRNVLSNIFAIINQAWYYKIVPIVGTVCFQAAMTTITVLKRLINIKSKYKSFQGITALKPWILISAMKYKMTLLTMAFILTNTATT